jgi:UDP-GlcNAc:undecaprenyl-phosphate GlcNAc-1-phosphate transferase
MIYLTSLLISMVITIVLIPFFRGLALRWHAGLDQPDERKVHSGAVPRTGGLGMAIGATVPVLLWAPHDPFSLSLMIGSGIIVLFGVLDDVHNLGFKSKFAAQIGAALAILLVGGVRIRFLGDLLPPGTLVPDWIGAPLTLVLIVGVTDAINLSDGLDGLAGGISMLSFICIGFLALVSGHTVIALFATTIVGAILGFLRFNTYPATVFMGDCGSQLLGFMAISLSLGLTQGHAGVDAFVNSPVLPLLLVGFPVLDTLTVMSERIWEGNSPFKADKKHFHHRLLRLNLFHREAVLVIYILQTLLVTAAFILRFRSEWALLSLYGGFCLAILSFFGVADAKGWRLNRHIGWFDQKVKGRLRWIRKRRIPIRMVFGIVRVGVPGLLLFSCFLPDGNPRLVLFPVLFFLAIAVFLWRIRPEWAGGWLSMTFYLISPLVIYLSERNRVDWMTDSMMNAYDLAFAFLFFCVILTLRFTRRRKGFRSTPLDFLILFIALVVPNLPDPEIQEWQMGLVAAKIIVLYFSYEVLVGELRVETETVRWTTLLALGILTVRMAASM